MPRILLVDSYDSFSHNLASLCRKAISDCHVHIIKNDILSIHQLIPVLPYFDAIVVGPGPGSPENASDVGLVSDLWHLPECALLPIFGVCLGLQSLAIAFGAHLKRLRVVKHGQISRIQHDGSGLFKGIGVVHAVRYHSLHVVLEERGEIDNIASADDGEENGKVVMAIKHKTRPFYAVQYHPESVCTSAGGVEMFRNFWRLANAWSMLYNRTPMTWTPKVERLVGPSWPHPRRQSPINPSRPFSLSTFSTIEFKEISVASLCERVGASEESSPFVLLESASSPGRFSIIGCLHPTSVRITYRVGEPFVDVFDGRSRVKEPLDSSGIWSWIASFMRNYMVLDGPLDIPFWGGLVGYLGYELGVSGLDIPLPACKSNVHGRHPDVNLAFVERSIVVDHSGGTIYVQSLISDDSTWIDETLSLIRDLCTKPLCKDRPSSSKHPIFTKPPTIVLPDEALYKSRINRAKEYLLAGDSYELCLTAHTHITAQTRQDTSRSSSWELYKLLQTKNPAPHSGYLRLHPSTLLSSSPERFLSFSRPPNMRCQLRPIKGTVRKAPHITREVAEELLAGSQKEVAENLMIVDLIRHDLHGVVGDDVVVKQFCRVEEYETVWQLVSVIEGGLDPGSPGASELESELGWEVLRSSLPPGSMTGAPKKRSVEILQSLEDHDRSIYSGVFGYWCVGGGGDWSVVIRSSFKHDEHGECLNASEGQESPVEEHWVVGAGGAITALSDAQAEWDEMIVKLQSVLQTFSAAATNVQNPTPDY
ncbi:para-aminobenzoate synthase [Amylostereum chailletii]|nr:para-aminobenzoate synthase [Amylostereum chailletii]